jgi:uncharacterized protein YutE (UPF0331/DUF86 family)
LVDRDVFDRRLGKLEDLLRRLRSVAAAGWDDFRSNAEKQASTERWLQLAAECALDLAHHLIADRGLRTPKSYREPIQVLEEEGTLPEKLARDMEGWAGLRNLLVHLYMDVNHERIFEIVRDDLNQLEEFAAAVSKAASQD